MDTIFSLIYAAKNLFLQAQALPRVVFKMIVQVFSVLVILTKVTIVLHFGVSSIAVKLFSRIMSAIISV